MYKSSDFLFGTNKQLYELVSLCDLTATLFDIGVKKVFYNVSIDSSKKNNEFIMSYKFNLFKKKLLNELINYFSCKESDLLKINNDGTVELISNSNINIKYDYNVLSSLLNDILENELYNNFYDIGYNYYSLENNKDGIINCSNRYIHFEIINNDKESELRLLYDANNDNIIITKQIEKELSPYDVKKLLSIPIDSNKLNPYLLELINQYKLKELQIIHDYQLNNDKKIVLGTSEEKNKKILYRKA